MYGSYVEIEFERVPLKFHLPIHILFKDQWIPRKTDNDVELLTFSLM